MSFWCIYTTTIVFIPKISCYLIFLVWDIEIFCIFIIIYITLLRWLLVTFLDDIEVLCHWTVAFRGSWFLNKPRSIIVGFLLEFRFLCLHHSLKDDIVALVPCIFFYFDILVLKDSYEALLINVKTKIIISTLSNCIFKIVMLYGFTAALIISMTGYRQHFTQRYYLPPFGMRGSLTFYFYIGPYTATLCYILFALIYSSGYTLNGTRWGIWTHHPSDVNDRKYRIK